MTNKNKEETQTTEEERAAVQDRIFNGEPVDDQTGEVGESLNAPVSGGVFNPDGSLTDEEPEWDSVEGGVQMEFTNDGDFIQGMVTSVGSTELVNKQTGVTNVLGKYTIMAQKGLSDGEELTNGELYTVIGTYAIDESLKGQPNERGEYPNAIKPNSFVMIKFEGWTETRGDNRFRQFTIKKANAKPRQTAPQT